MSASLDFEQEYCPFCGTDTEIGQKYCHSCGALLEGLELVHPTFEVGPKPSSLNTLTTFTTAQTSPAHKYDTSALDFSWYQAESQEIFLPAWIQYSGVLNPINKPVHFLDVLDKLVCSAELRFSRKSPGIEIFFQLAPHLEQDLGVATWTLVYELNSYVTPCWSILTKSKEVVGSIESQIYSKREKSLLARDAKGAEILLKANWSLNRIILNDLFKATLDFLQDTPVWQGFGSDYSLSFRATDAAPKHYSLICAGGLGGTFFQFNRCNEITREMDFRCVFSLLGLQAFGIWDMTQLNDMIALRY